MSHDAATSAGDSGVELGSDGHISVRGEMTFATVSRLRVDSLRLFPQVRGLHFDLGGVRRADSAGLALLIEWMREARKRQHHAHFSNIPDAIRVIAELSEVDDLLPA